MTKTEIEAQNKWMEIEGREENIAIAIEFVEREQRLNDGNLKEVRDEIENKNCYQLLVWNILEDGMFFELVKNGLNHMKRVLEEADNPEKGEPIDIFETQKERIIGTLIGGDMIAGTQGPWESRSSSPGDRRKAVVEANYMREEISTLKEVIEILER